MDKAQYAHECVIIEQDCLYTAEAHHGIALRHKSLSFWFQVIPASIAAILGVLVGSSIIPFWTIWLSVVSAVIAAVGNVLNPLKEYYDHLNAAKNFTTLKHDARALHETFSEEMGDKEYAVAVKNLHERYCDLVRFAPPTDKKSFEAARKRIQRDRVHEPDPT